MRKIITIITILMGQIFPCSYALSIVSPFYFVDEDNNKITYEYHESYVVDGADIETFAEISISDTWVYMKTLGVYAKDKNNVYVMGKVILDADPKTFIVLSNNNRESMPNVGKDKNHVYFNEIKMNDIDTTTFEWLGEGFSKDKSFVYYEMQTIPELDPKTFKKLGSSFSKDKNGLYYQTTVLEYDGDLESTQVHNVHFLVDDTYVYFNGYRIKESDSSSFLYSPGWIGTEETARLQNMGAFDEVDVGEYFDIDQLPRDSESAVIWSKGTDYSYAELYERFGNWRRIRELKLKD